MGKIAWADFAPDSRSVYISFSCSWGHTLVEKLKKQHPELFVETGKIIQYSLTDGKKIRELKDESILENFRFYLSQDGKKILFEGVKKTKKHIDGEVVQKGIWMIDDSRRLVWLPDIPSGGRTIDFSDSYHTLGHEDGRFAICDIGKQKVIYAVDLHAKIGEVKFSSDGKKIAVGSGGSCYLFRVE